MLSRFKSGECCIVARRVISILCYDRLDIRKSERADSVDDSWAWSRTALSGPWIDNLPLWRGKIRWGQSLLDSAFGTVLSLLLEAWASSIPDEQLFTSLLYTTTAVSTSPHCVPACACKIKHCGSRVRHIDVASMRQPEPCETASLSEIVTLKRGSLGRASATRCPKSGMSLWTSEATD